MTGRNSHVARKPVGARLRARGALHEAYSAALLWSDFKMSGQRTPLLHLAFSSHLSSWLPSIRVAMRWSVQYPRSAAPSAAECS